MSLISKKSLETLKEKIDLLDLLSSYVELKKSGALFKGLCPFHEEKTPSFTVQLGQSHYHCYGCGAHGDAIEFIMRYLSITFVETVHLLAERFGMQLEEDENKEHLSKTTIRDALNKTSQYYHFFLMHTKEGQKALSYLYERGFSLAFIRKFSLGWALREKALLFPLLKEDKIDGKTMEEAGLCVRGKKREFFLGRMMIPIHDVMGNVIGFTGRRIEDGWGPKYINTPEGPLFKKSKILFGLYHSRKRIIKEKRALIVEGQLDALRLIDQGYDYTIACQGTAFTESHAKELIQLGIEEAILAFDADNAGRDAAEKVGHLLQKEGVDVSVILLEKGMDPDLILWKKGKKYWDKLLKQKIDYLSFLVEKHKEKSNLSSPAQKNALIQAITDKIKQWDHPLMVHESLKKVSRLLDVPPHLLGITSEEKEELFYQRPSITFSDLNPNEVLEGDFLRWLILMGDSFVELARKNISPDLFKIPPFRKLYETILQDRSLIEKEEIDVEQKLALSQIMQKKVNQEKAYPLFLDVMQKILDRRWMEMRENIKKKIYQEAHNDEQLRLLAQEFDAIKKCRPHIEGVTAFVEKK